MPIILNHWGLYTDYYELTMAQGYFYCGKKDDRAVFNYFFRTNPFNNGFTVFAGLQDLLDALPDYRFSGDDIVYLEEQGFKKEFLDYLRDFKFSGSIDSVREGELIFPNEPVLQVEGNIIECQLIESLLLNILNFESLIATKAFRIKQVSGKNTFSDFGLRRAQGLGAIHGSRAAVIGGAISTSNVLAGKLFNIPVSGTQAHSWIQSFDTELEAFAAFTKINPENSILLVDTINTLKSGVPHAIIVAKEMEKTGHRLKAIRLDSGDLAYLSKKARLMLDDAGLQYVKIFASNQLDEYVIKSLLKDQNAPIDGFGVGTELITGKKSAALDGVYKLTEINGRPKMKLSDNPEKITLPGKKQLFRFYDNSHLFYGDAILLDDENPDEVKAIYHPGNKKKYTSVEHHQKESLLFPAVHNGKVVVEKQNPVNIHRYLLERAALLPEEHLRFNRPHIYRIGISEKLMKSRDKLAMQMELEY
jgi:nicotinate phosphoribosyltransferase